MLEGLRFDHSRGDMDMMIGPILRGYNFHRHLDMLQKGYEAARDTLYAEIANLEKESESYENDLANGGEWIGMTDEEGRTFWDQSQVYGYRIEDTHLALYQVRKAFVIAYYHFWEDSVAIWMNANSQCKHPAMERFCAEQGYGPSPDLDAVRCLANYFKHGRNSRTDWRADLFKKHPAFMPSTSARLLVLSEDTMTKVLETVRSSGPPRTTHVNRS